MRERREILKRVVEFDSFSSCYPDNQLAAKGLVAEIQKLINVKDSFTRMTQQRNRERHEAIKAREAKLEKKLKRRQALEAAKKEFFALFAESDPHKRGRMLEPVVSRLFAASGIPVREPFRCESEQVPASSNRSMAQSSS